MNFEFNKYKIAVLLALLVVCWLVVEMFNRVYYFLKLFLR